MLVFVQTEDKGDKYTILEEALVTDLIYTFNKIEKPNNLLDCSVGPMIFILFEGIKVCVKIGNSIHSVLIDNISVVTWV